jgi:hypothetical protein
MAQDIEKIDGYSNLYELPPRSAVLPLERGRVFNGGNSSCG